MTMLHRPLEPVPCPASISCSIPPFALEQHHRELVLRLGILLDAAWLYHFIAMDSSFLMPAAVGIGGSASPVIEAGIAQLLGRPACTSVPPPRDSSRILFPSS